jgi:hypothetical protein
MNPLAPRLAVAWLLAAGSAHAEPVSTAADDSPRRFAVRAGFDVLETAGGVCPYDGSDTASCGWLGYVGVGVAPAVRVARDLWVGLNGRFFWSSERPGPDGEGGEAPWRYALWQVSADARYALLRSARITPWLGAEAGMASTAIFADRGASTTTVHGPASAIFGGAFGLDFGLAPYLVLGPELRAFGLFTPHPEQGQLQSGTPYSGWAWGVSLGVGAEWRFGVW